MSWGNLTEERVALYLTEVLEALHYLHSWRIAHLDLKVNKCYWKNTKCVNTFAHQQGNRVWDFNVFYSKIVLMYETTL